MSKRSRRRNAADRGSKHSQQNRQVSSGSSTATPASSTTQTPSTVRSPLRRFARRRVPLLLAAVCLVAIGGIVYDKSQKKETKLGIMEYSSDDPNAMVIIEKDGEEIPFTPGSKFNMKLEPGPYKLRLAHPNDELKLHPPSFNLDPGGRAFVTVRKTFKSLPR